MRSRKLLYIIILNRLIEYNNNRSISISNGLCYLPYYLFLDKTITGIECDIVSNDLDIRLQNLPNISGYCNYKWIPMNLKGIEGEIQPRIEFIRSIIKELKNEG